MRKKLMSCVVALAFVMSIATNVVFAAESTPMGSGQQGSESVTSQLDKNPVTDQDAAKKIFSSVSTVYNYVGGQMVAIGDVNKGFTLLRDGQAFMSIGYDPFTGGYSVSGVNLNGSDWEAVEAAGGLKNYLMAMGIPESMLQVQEEVYDKDGNPAVVDADAEKYKPVYGKDGTEYKTLNDYNNRKSVDVAWLAEAEKTLKSGINYGISVNFAGGPATLTTMRNNQATGVFAAQTYNGKLFQTAEFEYTNGFLTKQTSWSIGAAYSSKANEYIDALNKWLAQDTNRKAEDFPCPDNLKDSKKAFENEAGSVKYEPRKSEVHFNGYGQQSYITNHEGKVINTFQYAANGAIVSQKDLRSGLTYNYQNNQVANITNEKGFLMSQYNYDPNGALNNVVNYNNSNQVSMNVFLYGKDLGNVNFTGGVRTADQARADYLKITKPGNTEAQIRDLIKASQFSSIQFYGAHLTNTAFMNVMLNPGNDPKKVGEANLALSIMTRNLNPHMPAGSSKFTFDKNGRSEEVYYTIEGSDKRYTQDEYSKYLESLGVDKSTMDNGGEVSYGSGSQKDSKKVTKHTQVTTWENFNVVTTINSRGQAAYDLTGSCKFNEKVGNWTETTANTITRQYDPAVVGTVNAYYDAEGKVIEDIVAYRAANPDAKIFAKVSAEGINMMDGSGFKPADGEEIMIDISSLSDEDLSALSETGKGLFMGDVNKTMSGQYVMSVRKDYNVEVNGKNYGGFVTGSDLNAAVSEVDAQSKAALNGESKYNWMNTNTKANREIFGLGSGSYLNDWRAGWAVLAGWN